MDYTDFMHNVLPSSLRGTPLQDPLGRRGSIAACCYLDEAIANAGHRYILPVGKSALCNWGRFLKIQPSFR